MTDFSLVAPGPGDANGPQIDKSLQERDRQTRARALAGVVDLTPEQKNQNLLRGFKAAQQVDPHTQRLARRTAAAAGLSYETALQDPKFATDVIQQRELESRDLWNRHPTVARLLEDGDFASIVSDDIESLVKTDGFLNIYWAGRQVASGFEQQERGDVWRDVMNSGGQKTLAQQFQLDRLDAALSRHEEEQGLLGGALNVVGQMASTSLYALPTAAAGAMAGSVVPGVGTVAGAGAGAKAAIFGRSFYVERGAKYGELRDLGLSHEEAEKGSFGYALVVAGLETIGWGFLSAPAKKMVVTHAASKVAAGLSKDLMQHAGRKFLVDSGIGAGGELATEGLQTVAGHFADLWAIESSSLDAQEKMETVAGMQELSTKVADTLVQTLKSIGPISVVLPAIRLRHEAALARRAAKASQLLSDIVKTSGESKLAQEAPEAFARVLNEQAKKAGVETIYVDPEAFEAAIATADKADLESRAKEAGISAAEMAVRVGEAGSGTRAMLMEKLPEVMNRLGELRDKGEQVEIPTSTFVEVFRDTRLLLLLEKHIKFERTGRTAAQAADFEAAKELLQEQARKAVEENSKNNEDLLRGVEELREEVSSALKGIPVEKLEGEQPTPMTSVESNTATEWVVNAAIVGAKEDKVSVAEWWAQNKFTVLSRVAPDKDLEQESLQAAGRRAVPTDPRLQEAAKALAAGKITRAQYDEAVNLYKPVRPFAEPALPASMDQVTGAVNAPAKAKVSAPEAVEDGREVSIRLDIPALAKGVGVVTVHEKSSGFKAGSPIAYTPAARLVNAVMGFVGGKAFKIAQGEGKDTIGTIKGTYKAESVESIQAAAKDAFTDPAWRQVGGDPERHAYFYDRETMQPIVSADEVIQIGNMVLAKNPVYGKPEEFLYSASRKGTKEDATYLAAVERGDMKAAQEMVDAAAKLAGYGYFGVHWTNAEEFTEFDPSLNSTAQGKLHQVPGFWFTGEETAKSPFGKRPIRSYISLRNPRVYKTAEAFIEEQDATADEGIGLRNKLQQQGHDGIVIGPQEEWLGSQEWDFTNYVAFSPEQIKAAAPVTYGKDGNVIPLSQRFQAESPDIRYAEGRGEGGTQGAYFPRTQTIALYEAATITTFLHEASHWWMTTLFARARQPNAAPAVTAKLNAALAALGVDSLETWDALSVVEREARHEAFAYNFEDYLLQGRAPTEEQRGLFAAIARWTRRLYSNLRETLSATYKREFGQDLPMLSPELRQVFDRMTATEEQLEATEMLRDLLPMFQTREEALASGMTPDDWDKFEQDVGAAREMALERLATASIDQMKNLAGAINDTLASKQRSMATERNKTREEVAKELRVQKIYRIIRWLQTKVALNELGEEFTPTLPNKIAVKDVVHLIEAGAIPDLKQPAAAKAPVVADKSKLAEQELRANEMRQRLEVAQRRLEILRKEHKNLPKNGSEGLESAGLIYESRAELDAVRDAINQAEAAVVSSRSALAAAEVEYEQNRKKSKKVRIAEGLTEEQWQEEQRGLEAQLPDEVQKVERLDQQVLKTRKELDSRGTANVPKFQAKVNELVQEVEQAEKDLKVLQKQFTKNSEDARTVAPEKREQLMKDLGELTDKIKPAETKLAQKQSNLAKARVDLADARKRPTHEGTDRDRLQTNLRNFMAQRKKAEEQLSKAQSKIRRQAEAKADAKRQAAKAKLQKAQDAFDRQRAKMDEVSNKLTKTARQKAAVEVRRTYRFVQSEQIRLRELDKRNELLAKRIELNEPTIQGPVLEKLGNMLTKQDSGIVLQAVAVLWGVDGGAAELLRMLYEAPPLDEAIESETDRRMLEKHGDYQSREDAEAVVADAMHEKARTKMVATELGWLQDQVRQMVEDLDPDLVKRREENAAELVLAEQQVEALATDIQKAREIAQQSPALQALDQQRASAVQEVQDATAAVKAAAGGDVTQLQSAVDAKRAALKTVLDQIDQSYGPDVDRIVAEWTKAKERVAGLKKLGRKRMVSVDAMVSAAAAVADDAIDNTMVKEISSAKHQAEEGRQNRKVMDALATSRAKDKKGTPRLFKAMEAKRLQLVHHMKAKAARRAEKQIKKIEAAMRRAFKSPLENVKKNYNAELYTAARALAALFGFGPEVAVARAAEQLQATSKYHPEMWGRIQDILGPSIMQARQVQDYRELTFSQLLDVHQTVQGILELARAERVVELHGKTVEVEAARAQLTESLAKHRKPYAGMGTKVAVSNWQKFLKVWDGTKAWLRSMEQWAVAIDGKRGAWWDLVYNPVKAGLNEYSVHRNRLVNQYATWLSELDIDHDAIKSHELGKEFKGMAEVLGALLHVGNMSNYRKLLLGRQWGVEVNKQLDDSKWLKFIDRLHSEGKLKKEHWDFVQKVWDMMEGLKPDLQKAHNKVFGFFFREVRYSPVVTPFGVYRGGYVPAKTDPLLVAGKQSEEDINQINGDMRSAVPSVSSGWRHERVEAYTQPLNLDLTMLLRHIDETVRFIHVQPEVQNVLRIIRPFEQRNSALGEVDQEAYSEFIIPWMVSAARQVTSTRGSAFGHHVLDRLRRWTGMDALFSGFGNALGNITALPMAVRKIGVGAVLSGLRQYVTGSTGTDTGGQTLSKWIASNSPFMSNRQHGKMLELAHMLDSLVNNPGAYRKVKRLAEKNAYWAQVAVQSVADYAIWKGAYDKFKTMPEAKGLDEQRIHELAVEFADYVVRDSAPSLSPEDQAKYLKGGPLMRLLVQYSGYFNWLANVNVTDFGNMIRETGWRTPLTLRFYQQLILGYAVPLFVADAIMSGLAGKFFDDEDDEELGSAVGRNVLAAVGRGTASMFPGVGQVAMALYGLGTEDPHDERVTNAPAVGYIMRAGRGAMAVGREVGEAMGLVEIEKEVSGREVRDIFGLLSLLTGGLPTSWLGKPAQFLTDVSQDKYSDVSAGDYLQGAMSGKADGASR